MKKKTNVSQEEMAIYTWTLAPWQRGSKSGQCKKAIKRKNNLKNLLCTALIIFQVNLALAEEQAEFAKRWKASELAGRFFGPEREAGTKTAKKPISLGGGVNISFGTQLECGNIDMAGSIKAEVKRLDKQFGLIADQIKNISPTSLSVAALCYYKPSLCSYIRHSSILFNEYLGVQVDACQAIDSFIEDQADKGLKQAKVDAVANCIKSRGGKNPTTEDIRVCQAAEPVAKNLLKPFQNDFVKKKQEVLRDTLKFVSSERDYNILASLLGEVEIKEDGFWRPLYPKGLLKTSDAVRNLIADGQSGVCDLKALKGFIESKHAEEKDFKDYVKTTIRDHFLLSDIQDLTDLPAHDQTRACHALGGGVADIAIRRIIASGKSSLSAALTNPALNEDIRVFFKDRSTVTFEALKGEIEAKNYPPLGKSLENMRALASAYRAKNRQSASGASAGTVHNEQNNKDCDDEISCKGL